MRNSTSDINSEAKQGQVTELKITGYKGKAVKILFDYIAGKPLVFLHFVFKLVIFFDY